MYNNGGLRLKTSLSKKFKRHESSRSHLDNAIRLQFFGKLSIAEQLDEGYRIGIRRHNEEVTKNRHILSRIIDCVKFCDVFGVTRARRQTIPGYSVAWSILLLPLMEF